MGEEVLGFYCLGLPAMSGQVSEVVVESDSKAGTNIRQEFIKMHEHIQAAEDAWVAEEGEK